MLLAIDVGNTNIVLGCLEDGEIIGITRMETDRDKTAHEYAIALKQALEFGGIDPSQLDGAILSSVVPPINGALRAAIQKHLRGHRNIKSFRLGEYGEGGAGVTVAQLK